MAIRRAIIVCLFVFLPHAQAQELKKLYVAIPALSPASTTFAVAKDKGYYKEEGFDVELVAMPSAIAVQALIGGNVKFATVGGAALPPILRGAPIRFLFTTFHRPMFWLFAKPEIRSVAELKGKRVGVSGFGSGPDSLLRDLLKKHGLEGGRDVPILPVGAGTARFAALQAGSVDAAMLSIPSNFLAQENGYRELVSFIDQDLVELQGSVLASQALMESDPVLIERFLRATLKGFRYFRENRPGTVQALIRFLRLPEDQVAKIYDLVRPGMTEDGTISEALQRKSLEHIVGRVGLKEPPPLDKIFDSSIARKVRDELQARGWKP